MQCMGQTLYSAQSGHLWVWGEKDDVLSAGVCFALVDGQFCLHQDVEKARKDVSDVQKQLASISKEINKIESLLDNERSNRHTILKQCKMDSINIPMRRGRLDEIEDEDDPSIDVSSSQSSHVIYEKEEKIKIDYTSLNSSLTVSNLEPGQRKV